MKGNIRKTKVQKTFRLSLDKPQDRYIYEQLQGLPESTQTSVIKFALTEYFRHGEVQEIVAELNESLTNIRTIEDNMSYLLKKVDEMKRPAPRKRENEYL